jgi:hypothetical protein
VNDHNPVSARIHPPYEHAVDGFVTEAIAGNVSMAHPTFNDLDCCKLLSGAPDAIGPGLTD